VTHILLTGAGFSRNWGLWLADEVFEYLLADSQITPPIRNELWRAKSAGENYEHAIQRLRDRALQGDDKDYRHMLTMLGGMFNAMKNSFSAQGFEFERTNDVSRTVSTFLRRFDWIFTLNQDTLLEYHYFVRGFMAPPKWSGFTIPGLEPISISPYQSAGPSVEPLRPKTSGFSLPAGVQPYIKLHGSHNWLTDTGLMLITGGNKKTDISDSPLLAWYSTLLEQQLCSPHARLMIIGYGFGDDHINEVILRAAKAGAKIFIIDLLGVDAFYRREISQKSKVGLHYGLIESIIGASRRPLGSTFSTDTVEMHKILQFFER